MQTCKTYYKSPLGPIEIVGSQDSILALDFVQESQPNDGELTFCVKDCLKQIDEYFKGDRREFYLNLQPAGTDFQKSVWRKRWLIGFERGEVEPPTDILA
jgi:methylated-DNA-[protein]-cysteine S-methyltransferase